ncbi:MAG: energy transducer TonB [Planctomycetota bacterium]|nr:energy transducer TonB [Planctomycetota bacterium]
MRTSRPRSLLASLMHGFAVLVGGFLLSLVFFLVLPFMQAIANTPEADLTVRSVATAEVPPPPPPPENEPEQEEQAPDEAKPPELTESAPPLDLNQLELALNPGTGGDGLVGDFAVKLSSAGPGQSQSNEEVEALFSLADLDQAPRVIYQPGPTLTAEIRKKAPGTVYVLFIVDVNGRVEGPIVQKSTDPVFDKAALNAVKQWKFEPGKRKGQAVRFRMRVPITFPEK